MTSSQVQCFLEAARHLNFNRAAENLFVSQQVVSSQIKALEEELNVTLFDRTNRRNIFLTESGEILYECLSRADKDINEGVSAARAKDVKNQTMLKFGIYSTRNAIDFSIGILSRFHDAHPEIILASETAGAVHLLERLNAGYIDFVITYNSELDYLFNFPHIDLGPFETQLCIMMNKNNSLAFRDSLTASDLNGQILYVLSKEFSRASSGRILSHLKSIGVTPAAVEYFDDLSSLELALNVGMGVTISFKPMYQRPERLKIYPIEPFFAADEDTQYVLAWKKKRNEKYAGYFKELI